MFLSGITCSAGLLGGRDYDIRLYGVQTIFADGSLSNGATPGRLHVTGPFFAPEINGDDASSAIYNWPMFMELAESVEENPDYDGGFFLVGNNGYRLYYINEEAGYATVFVYASPGNTNTVIARLIYSTDPSKENSGQTMILNGPYDSYGDSSSSSGSSKSSGYCSKCNGKGYTPERYQHATGNCYYNSPGVECPICGYSDQHYHYKCYH